ncbi:hypothetical protein [Desulfosediminicola flagellatus]|uniref:hypothetical protein n=1 Tax=Desulfosediminicola flagellatus TaxID=2569541 RepID=UPI0012946BD6|nr:hypothetical protein [Desulfosediminicola flagellatus]
MKSNFMFFPYAALSASLFKFSLGLCCNGTGLVCNEREKEAKIAFALRLSLC